MTVDKSKWLSSLDWIFFSVCFLDTNWNDSDQKTFFYSLFWKSLTSVFCKQWIMHVNTNTIDPNEELMIQSESTRSIGIILTERKKCY